MASPTSKNKSVKAKSLANAKAQDQAFGSIVTLCTDFGNIDGYVGIVKGVMLGIYPHISIVDLSHEIPPWNLSAASWIIGNSYKHFPAGSIHLVVVDPGVGSQRRAIALSADGHIFVAPDNGVLSSVLNTAKDIKAYELDKKEFWLDELSSTFHARDLFAPVAAHLSSGVSLAELATECDLEPLCKLALKELQIKQNRVEGSVTYIDRFGNLITNIKKEYVRQSVLCQVGKKSIGRIGHTYASAEHGTPVAFVGSHGYLEIAVSQGRADQKLEAGLNTAVILFESAIVSDKECR